MTRRHLEVLLHRDSSHRGAHFAEETEGELAPGLTVALRAEHHLWHGGGEMATSLQASIKNVSVGWWYEDRVNNMRLKSSSMHVSMNLMCVQHHTGSPRALLRDHVRPTRTDHSKDSVSSLYNSVHTRTRCTGETRQQHDYRVSKPLSSWKSTFIRKLSKS